MSLQTDSAKQLEAIRKRWVARKSAGLLPPDGKKQVALGRKDIKFLVSVVDELLTVVEELEEELGPDCYCGHCIAGVQDEYGCAAGDDYGFQG